MKNTPQEILNFSPLKMAFSSCTECSWQLQATCVNTHWDEVQCIQLHNKQAKSGGANMDIFESGGALASYPCFCCLCSIIIGTYIETESKVLTWMTCGLNDIRRPVDLENDPDVTWIIFSFVLCYLSPTIATLL